MDPGSLNYGLLVLAMVAIALGAVSKGLTGVGLPILAVPIMASFTSVETAVVLMVFPGLAANGMVVLTHRHWPVLRAHRVFLLLGFCGGILGTWLLSELPDRWLRLILAIGLGVYLVQYFLRRNGSSTHGVPRWLAGPLGVAAGAFQGSSGISAPVVGPYYHASGLTRSHYAFAAAFTFLLFGLAQTASIPQMGLFTTERLVIGTLLIIPTLVFTQLGIHYASRISDRTFNHILLVLFVTMEAKLVFDILTQ